MSIQPITSCAYSKPIPAWNYCMWPLAPNINRWYTRLGGQPVRKVDELATSIGPNGTTRKCPFPNIFKAFEMVWQVDSWVRESKGKQREAKGMVYSLALWVNGNQQTDVAAFFTSICANICQTFASSTSTPTKVKNGHLCTALSKRGEACFM